MNLVKNDEDEEMEKALQESLRLTQPQDEELLLAIKLSLEEKEKGRRQKEEEKGKRQKQRMEEEERKRKADEEIREKEEREKEERQRVRRQEMREEVEVMHILPLTMIELALFASNSELQVQLVRRARVSFEYPTSLSPEQDAFLVLIGSSQLSIDSAKDMIFRGIKDAIPKDDDLAIVPREHPSSIRAESVPCETYIFVDSNNILIGGSNKKVPVNLAKFCKLIERGRKSIVKRLAVGKLSVVFHVLYCFFYCQFCSQVSNHKNLKEEWKANNYKFRGSTSSAEMHDA
jgi:hypothetical protein